MRTPPLRQGRCRAAGVPASTSSPNAVANPVRLSPSPPSPPASPLFPPSPTTPLAPLAAPALDSEIKVGQDRWLVIPLKGVAIQLRGRPLRVRPGRASVYNGRRASGSLVPASSPTEKIKSKSPIPQVAKLKHH
ncbi:hypothetical protein U9M48_041447 [Paspalum notatum var. saurae]|uniref:Uncharacterized protein n=1 Tax=Paspalum notatum var. saurae TaxID=547442 RepID=A0AAQ3UND6_PASNO